jgi:protease-4
MNRGGWYWFLLLVLLTGCKNICISTRVKADVTTHTPTVGPVRPMAVERIDPCTALKIAIVDIDGLLLNINTVGPYAQGDNPVSIFRERLLTVGADPNVRAVIVRINSPGGGVTASDIMWHDLHEFRARRGIPVIACLMDVGAGGAYYVATAADRIMAHPTTLTGGIGVILNVYNLSDALAQQNITATPVKSGDNIDLGSPIKALDAKKRKLLQDMADEFHARFRESVLSSRQIPADVRDQVFDGRVFTATQAQRLGLVDTIGYVDDAIQMARELGGAPQATVVLYHRDTDRPFSVYSVTPNTPATNGLFPISIPGLERSKLPTFLYLWQPEPTLERLGGR